MTSKEYLSQYRQLDRAINSRCAELERLRTLATNCSTSYVDCSKGIRPAKRRAKYEPIVDRIIEVEDEVNAMIDKLLELRDDIASTIGHVEDPTLQALLRYYYICGWTFERIAVEMNYSWRWIIKLHGRALQEINRTW